MAEIDPAPKRKRPVPRTAWKKGQSGNPGGGSKKLRERYTEASIKGCPANRWQAVVDTLTKAAIEGDVSAAKVLASILPGALDTARVETVVSTPDGAGLVIRYENDWKPNLDAPTETPRAADGDAPPPA